MLQVYRLESLFEQAFQEKDYPVYLNPTIPMNPTTPCHARRFLVLFFLPGVFLSCSGNESTEPPLLPELRDGDFDYVVTADPRSPEEEAMAFHLPPGFEAQIFAAEPDIDKPINIAFDAKGRLWVTQSSAYPFPAPNGTEADRLTILEDTDGDGRADTFTDFADNLNIPIGVLPVADGAIVYSIPNLYHLIDTDGDDRADRREVLAGPFGYDDTHGMVNNLLRGLDGWLHAGHGYRNSSSITGTDGTSLTMVSGNTFRLRLDGTELQTTTTGRVNPFGFAYDERGYLYSADCHTNPIYQLIRGGDYPHFGKQPVGIGFPPTMMEYNHGPTAIAGLAFYTSNQFPPDFQENFYSGNPVSNRINRDKIVYHGSTPESIQQPDFLVSDDPWFRPVDVKLGPDGAFYIADFYNRIIGHYEVPLDHEGRDRERGRIWRIVYTGADYQQEPADADTDWSNAGIDALITGLDHPDVRVRMVVSDELVDRSGDAAIAPVQAILNEGTSHQQAHSLWILHRLDGLNDEQLEQKLLSADSLVSLHAFRVLAERPALSETQQAHTLAALRSDNPHLQRAASEVLARFPAAASIKSILAAEATIRPKDTHLAYTLRQSLRDHLRNEEIQTYALQEVWDDPSSRSLAAAMVGVDNASAATYLFQYVRSHPQQDQETLATYINHIARHTDATSRDELATFVETSYSSNMGLQLALFRAIEEGVVQGGGARSSLMQRWGTELATHFLTMPAASSPDQLQYSAELAGRLDVGALTPKLQKLVADSSAQANVRIAAARALVELDLDDALPLLAEHLQDVEEVTVFRVQLATMLGNTDNPTAHEAVIASMTNAPLRIQVAGAQAMIHSQQGKALLIRSAEAGRIPPRVLLDPRIQNEILADLPEAERQVYDRITADLEPIDLLLQREIETRVADFQPAAASSEAGREVFNRYCTACHQAEGEGGVIGPQLDGVGRRGPLLLTEKILAPNRSVTPGFETFTIRLQDGTMRTGMLRREEGETMVFADFTGNEFSIPSADIAEQTPSGLSLMPATFSEAISESEFNDLLRYLLTLR